MVEEDDETKRLNPPEKGTTIVSAEKGDNKIVTKARIESTRANPFPDAPSGVDNASKITSAEPSQPDTVNCSPNKCNNPGADDNNGQIHEEDTKNQISAASSSGDSSGIASPRPQTSSFSRWKRRNSVSLPAGLDTIMTEPPEYEPQLTPENVRNGGSYEASDTFSDAESSDGESCHIGGTSRPPRSAYRNVRKKSVYPLTNRDLNDLYDDGRRDHSPENSVTSINSIASLLKEKLMMSIPSSLRRQNTKDYKLKCFIGFLFLLIIFIISFSHIYYNQKVLQREYFPYTRFNKDQRYLKLYNEDGAEIALGYLGVSLPDTDRVYQCFPSDEDKDGSLCFEWMNHARIRLSHERKHGTLNCYNIRWYSVSESIQPMDCYEDGYQYGHWYGGGRTLGMAWPVELGRVEMSPFVTGHIGRHRWGSVLRRYFINSKGVAITVDSQTPLYVSINAGQENRLCLQGRHDQFTYITSTGYPTLNYTICTANNMKTLHFALSEKSLWDGLKESDTETINTLLSEPVWQIAPKDKNSLTETTVVNFTEDVISLGFFRQGHVLLNEFWQAEVGDFSFDTRRFPTINETLDVIHRRGFHIILTIQPFVSTESSNFAELVKLKYLVAERSTDSSRFIPALTQYKSLRSAGMLDVTNNHTRDWLQKKLLNFYTVNDVDALYLDLGSAYDLPTYYKFKSNLTNPDHYKSIFTDCVRGTVPVLGVSSAIKRPPIPVFLSLPSLQSSWESLQVIIPTILTYGIVGYPFMMPGPVGGNYIRKSSQNATEDDDALDIFEESEGHQDLPERELYIRWLQLATFLPVIRYTHLPSQYDQEVVELARNLTALRQQTINPLLIKYVKEALETGIPLIRPLWMMDPSDSTCHTVKDEFLVGEEIIVAPILRPKSIEREVYLPAGVWKDGIDGSLRKGSRWIHYYKATLNQIPYFVKKPDNTRL